MAVKAFGDYELTKLGEALDIAEDATGDFFKFSDPQWKRHRYDVKTLLSLERGEISDDAFAVLTKGSRVLDGTESSTKKRDYFFICLQDHHILKALKRDRSLRLAPLLVYVLTHELVHVVRFSSFQKRFEATGQERENEEETVHRITFDILKNITLSRLDYILRAYQCHRVCR